jgi:hypothetical protein
MQVCTSRATAITQGGGAASCSCCEEADAQAGVPCKDVLLQRQHAKAAVCRAAEGHVGGEAGK